MLNKNVEEIKTEFHPGAPAFSFTAPGTNVTIRVRGFHDIGVSRTVEAKYKL